MRKINQWQCLQTYCLHHHHPHHHHDDHHDHRHDHRHDHHHDHHDLHDHHPDHRDHHYVYQSAPPETALSLLSPP